MKHKEHAREGLKLYLDYISAVAADISAFEGRNIDYTDLVKELVLQLNGIVLELIRLNDRLELLSGEK